MSDETLRRQLQNLEGEAPSDDFVEALRLRIQEQATQETTPGPAGSTVIDFGKQGGSTPGRFGRVWLLAAAAALVGAMLLTQLLPDDGAPLETAATTEAREIGDAWLASIINNDRTSFVALHADDLRTNDTLMAYSQDVDLLTPARVAELYLDGFEAFQRSLAVDGDVVRAEGCDDIDSGQVRCIYTASLIGTDDYTYTVAADLTVESRLITAIDFTEISTEPSDLRSQSEAFFDEEATDEDRACLLLGFNTRGCGEHDSDFMRRYIAYYEARRSPNDG